MPTTHQVLVNHRGQHALYPAGRAAPEGWSPAGFEGDEEACAAHVDAHWTDTRPRPARGA
ncbi:MbtH family NRPS accessory protein [Streptomyces sp. BI20]|uniref:MbtH family NRPS accessory protein n=1 Tax=Streptomyces sp. BI20 TaxID=3403460 RepID=UPI003C77581B